MSRTRPITVGFGVAVLAGTILMIGFAPAAAQSPEPQPAASISVEPSESFEACPSEAAEASPMAAASPAAEASPMAAASPAAEASPMAAASPAAEASACPEGVASEVVISDFQFAPADMSVAVGTTVTWSNQGPSGHTVTADDGSFDSGTITAGSSFANTFDTAGTFTYHCSIHPQMTGTITVA
jgi:plastocyanin